MPESTVGFEERPHASGHGCLELLLIALQLLGVIVTPITSIFA